MDSLTQIVLGASVGEAVAGKKMGNKALLFGAICGTIPDLDIFFINDRTNLIKFHEIHRGFSHSFLFAILFAPIFGWLLQKLFKNKNYSFILWTKLCFWATVTHPILDSFTSWGTQLLNPFSNYKVAFNNIAIVDPFYTVPFLIFTIMILFFKRNNAKRKWLNYAGLSLSSAYIIFTFITKFFVGTIFEKNLQQQNIVCKNYATYPTILNAFLWKFVGKSNGEIKIGYYSIFDKNDKIKFYSFKSDDAPQSLQQNKYFKKLVEISKGFHLFYKDGENFKFKNALYIDLISNDDPREQEINYTQITKNNENNYNFKTIKMSSKVNIASMFSSLYRRIFSIKSETSTEYKKQAQVTNQTLYDFTAKTINGKDFDFAKLKGKKVMIVNVASKCGLTPQYKQLQQLHEKYKDKNFVLIGFPANNFMGQEPGENKEIQSFCQKNYGVSFQMMAKISVKGDDIHPLYKWLTQNETNKVKWNFQKFLIDEKGVVQKIIPPAQKPLSKEILNWIEK